MMKDWFDTEWLQNVWDNTIEAIKNIFYAIGGVIIYVLFAIVAWEVIKVGAYILRILRPMIVFLDDIFFK